MTDIIIVGAGPAGLTAALYAMRAGKKVLVFEALSYGGKIINALDIRNYPAIKEISGFDFATNLYNQVKDLGCEIKFEKVIDIEDLETTKKVITTKGEYTCRAVILATGVQNRPLNLPKEKEFIGKGISYCATCDGAFYKEKVVAVNGGGNTAIGDALFLSEYCKKVYIIYRGDSFKRDLLLVEKLKEKDNVEFVFNSNVTKLIGKEKLEKIEITNKETKEKKELEVSCLFIAIGQIPENNNFAKLVNIDDKGYIIADESCKTNIPGIYVAGDTRVKEVRQLTTAEADGTVAALTAVKEMK